MASLRVSASAVSVRASAQARPILPVRRTGRVVSVRAQLTKDAQCDAAAQVGKALAITTAASSFLMAGNATAATELSQLAASDNRVGIIATLFLPVLGWVGFNILQPALNQLDAMEASKGAAKGATKKRSIVGPLVGLGAAASLLAAENADAATELSQLAASDNRVGIIATLFLPVLGWVGFNILQPALNQLDAMEASKGAAKGATKKRSIVGPLVGLGAAASLLAAENADAATELSQLAASDNRVGIIATLFLPVLGWVGFNILQPALNQLDAMEASKGAAKGATKKRSIVGPLVGLGAAASLLAAENADAATELSQLAASDNRVGIIATLFLPVLGWVGFNILQPALNQLDAMEASKGAAKVATKKRSIVGPLVGLGAAASLLAAENADAATELSQLAASDNRVGIIATLFLPVLGWVGFNILQPALNQLSDMEEKKGAKKGRK